MKVVVFLLIAILSETALAYKPDKCFKYVTSGSFRNYDYPGNISSEYMTKKHGSTYGPTEATFQTLTSFIDPFVLAGRLTSTSQFSTSWGACDYFAFHKEKKSEYIAKNGEAIKQEVAMGRGEHLKAVYFYSQCNPSAMDTFYEHLQMNYDYLNKVSETGDRMVQAMDLLMLQSPMLRSQCEII